MAATAASDRRTMEDERRVMRMGPAPVKESGGVELASGGGETADGRVAAAGPAGLKRNGGLPRVRVATPADESLVKTLTRQGIASGCTRLAPIAERRAR